MDQLSRDRSVICTGLLCCLSRGQPAVLSGKRNQVRGELEHTLSVRFFALNLFTNAFARDYGYDRKNAIASWL